MAQATPISPEALAAGTVVPRRFGHLARRLGRELDMEDFRTGGWFSKLVALYLRHDDLHAPHERDARADSTEALIHRACVEAALMGTGGAAVSTGASVYAADTGGMGLLVALPVSVLAVGGEMLLRTLIHLRMTCDLASAFGVPFHPDDPADLSRLYALVFGTERHEDSQDPGVGLVRRLVSSEAEDLGEQLGGKLLGESTVRNLLPFASVVTSPLTSWKRTRRLGDTVLGYVRFRRALADAFTAVPQPDEAGRELLVESAWFLLTASGRLTHVEAAVLVHLLGRLPPDARQRVLTRMVGDEADWRRRLQRVPEPARDSFLQALVVLSAADTAAPPAEWHTLERAALALERSLDRGSHELLMRRFGHEGVVPPKALSFRKVSPRKRAHPPPARAEAAAPGVTHH